MKRYFLQLTSRKWVMNLLFFLAASLPLVLFLNTLLRTPNGMLPSDWDYFAQLYEAARRSILEFRQFPWWNPWVAGGVPLYANPQFGLFSVQMPFVILFGTLPGLHLAIFVYFLAGYWGMYKLLGRLGADRPMSLLLAYIWVFSSFPVWHFAVGHLTFGTYFLAPWFFYFLLNIRNRLGWLWLGLFTAFLINQSIHYLTIHILCIGLVVAIYQIYSTHRLTKTGVWHLTRLYFLSLCVVTPLVAHKLFHTLLYLSDFSRIPPQEVNSPINLMVAALTFRGTKVLDPTTFARGFGWAEYGAYFGLVSLVLFAYLLIRHLERIKTIRPQQWLLLAGIATTLLLAIGPFEPISPYGLLKQLPVFENMQVASRWLGWSVLGMVLYLAWLPKKRLMYALLLVSALDVFSSSYHVINFYYGDHQRPVTQAQTFQQQALFRDETSLSSENLYLRATQANIGNPYGYEPIVGFYGDRKSESFYKAHTKRCTRGEGCSFIISQNAVVTFWSPNKIVLERTGPGDIQVNMNPGEHWLINGRQAFPSMRIMELNQDFIITDEAPVIALELRPKIL